MSDEVPGYVLLDEVGRGASSTVHRARPTDRPGRIVAVKRLQVGADDEAVARLQREAEVLASLAHPAIVPLLDVVDDGDGGIALVLPFAPGGSLEDLLAREGRLPWPRVADVGARLATALSAAHGAGVLHRDVKPANVLLGVEDEPRLADFGTVVLRDGGQLVDDGVVMGTAEYVDPAVVVDGDDPGPRSDLYSLAVVLYRALSGQLPHAGGSLAATVAAADRGVHAPLGDLVDAPAELVDAVERALSRRPEDRFGAVQQLGTVLDGLARRAEGDRLRDLADQLGDPSGTAEGEASLTTADVPTDPPARRDPVSPRAGPDETPGAGSADTGTRLFGPRPTVDGTSGPDRSRPGWVAPAVVAVVLVPLVVVAALWWSSRGDGPGSEVPEDVEARQAAPRCEGVEVPPGDGEVLDADVDGRGCSLPLVVSVEEVDGQSAAVLTVPDAAGDGAGRYVVADGRDQVVVGDWDCDGTDTPGVYRQGDGAVYLYDGYGELTPEEGPRLPPGGQARVVTSAGGCDELAVADAVSRS